jgi:hypothetical protein
MKFTILVSDLKEISPSAFSWKKRIYKKLRCNSTVNIRISRKKILNYAYVLKNGVGRYNIFLLFFHKACWILLLCHFRVESVNIFIYDMCFFSANNFAHAETLYRMRSLCRSYECMNIMWVNIECFTGCKRIKQQRISFVPGYLRMILWKISTAISIKHRILTTFNIKKKSILTACMPLI